MKSFSARGDSSVGHFVIVKLPPDQLLLCCLTRMVVGCEVMYSVRRAMGCLRGVRVDVMVSDRGRGWVRNYVLRRKEECLVLPATAHATTVWR